MSDNLSEIVLSFVPLAGPDKKTKPVGYECTKPSDAAQKALALRSPSSHKRSPGVLIAGKLDILPVSLPQHLKGFLQAFIVLRPAHQLSCGPTDDLGIPRSTDYSSRVCRIWRWRARNRGAGIKEITLKDTKMLLAFTVGTRMDTLYI